MAKFPVNQKKPNKKEKEIPVEREKTPRAKISPIGFPTSEGDLGILRIKPQPIPKQTRHPSSTGDSISHAMGNIMKKAGILK